MRILFMMAVLGGLILATPGQSYAQEERAGGAAISRIQPDKLAAILTAGGYPSEVQSDNSGSYVATTMSGIYGAGIPL